MVGASNCVGERLGGELWSKDLLAVELHELLLEVLLMDFLANRSNQLLTKHFLDVSDALLVLVEQGK